MAQPPSSPDRARTISFITRGNNKTVQYRLTSLDYLTLARAVEFEGQPRAAVAWTLIQRFAFVYPTFPTLHALIQAYAQPINPAWFPTGQLHLNEVARLRKLGLTAAADDEVRRARLRLSKALLPLSSISQETLNALAQVFSGVPSPVPGSVHYRAPTITTTSKAAAETARAKFAADRHLLDTVRVGDPTADNWFFAVTGSQLFRVALSLDTFIAVGYALLALIHIAALSNLVRTL